MILTLGRIVGVEMKARQLLKRLQDDLLAINRSAQRFADRPRVFFEEWNDPLISGIRWVEELIEIAGGAPVFPEMRERKNAKDRIISPAEVAARNPEVVIASWCGRMVQKKQIRERSGWGDVDAVRHNHIYEVKSTYILQPGPAALTEGVRQLHVILAHATGVTIDPHLAPLEKVDRDLQALIEPVAVG